MEYLQDNFKTQSFFDPSLLIAGTSQCAFVKCREAVAMGMHALACSFTRDVFHIISSNAPVQRSLLC